MTSASCRPASHCMFFTGMLAATWGVPKIRVPLWVPLHIKCRNAFYSQKGPMILRITQMLYAVAAGHIFLETNLRRSSRCVGQLGTNILEALVAQGCGSRYASRWLEQHEFLAWVDGHLTANVCHGSCMVCLEKPVPRLRLLRVLRS